MSKLLTITAKDYDKPSDNMSRTFTTDLAHTLKEAILEFEVDVPYRRYELMTDDLLEDYSEDIQEVLVDAEVSTD